MFNFQTDGYEALLEKINEESKKPKLLRVHVSKFLEDQSICKKFPEGKDFYLIMGYDFLKKVKDEVKIDIINSNNLVSLYGVPLFVDDKEKFKEMLETSTSKFNEWNYIE